MKRFFLSVTVIVLCAAFIPSIEGNEKLFRDLYIHDKWDWAKCYPVLKIDFTGGMLKNREELEAKIETIFSRYQEKHQISLRSKGTANRFGELIEKLKEKQNANLQFVFLTGVSKFSKVNIFSGINNLNDITLDPNYAGICGYTHHDLETSFQEHLAGVDWEELKVWYNGHNFLGERVYNPFDILQFISKNRQFRNYWFETGTPSFLVKLFQKHRYFLPDIDDLEVGEVLLSSFEIEAIDPITLLFKADI